MLILPLMTFLKDVKSKDTSSDDYFGFQISLIMITSEVFAVHDDRL